jgi:recombination protein RecR
MWVGESGGGAALAPSQALGLVAYYPEPVARLIEALQRLPGIGPKTAQRLTFFLLKRPSGEVQGLAESLTQLKQLIVHCRVCFNVTDEDPCRICSDPRRDARALCIVEEPNDLLALERTGEFRGRYHVLLGALSPLDGIGPEDLRVRELLVRLETPGVEEVILATNPSVEGEATAIYLAKLLKPLGMRITRIARGLPVGGDLEYADEVTLSKALEGRRDVT